MVNIKNISKGFLVSALLIGALAFAAPARADDGQKDGPKGAAFLGAQASFKADLATSFKNAVAVILGSNNVRVMGAKVSSVSGSTINAIVPFGNSSLSFVINTNAQSKLNGKLLSDSSVLANLKAGDNISFSGTVASSTTSSITVNATNLVSAALIKDKKLDDEKNSFNGTISAINSADSSFTLKLKSGVSVQVDAASVAGLTVGDEVRVNGTLNSTGTVITATKVSTDKAEMDNEQNDGNSQGKPENGGFWGKIMNWFWK